MVALYSVTIGLSAALVFVVQPMFARFILPLAGGTPSVWAAAMVFFTTTLLLGYLYAHWSIRRLGARRQAVVHLAVAAIPLVTLPVALPAWDPPTGSTPVWWVLGVLAAGVGLPFFVVTTTAPLLQRWVAATDHPDAADPYFLYRTSNAGSLLGLLAYPFLIEPELGLRDQARLWSLGYVAFLVLLGGCVLALRRAGEPRAQVLEATGPGPAGLQRVRWVGIAFIPSSLMLGVTSFVSVDLAPIPLLWVVPLALYLLSFVIAFSPGARWLVVGAGYLLLIGVVTLALVVGLEDRTPLAAMFSLHLGVFFVAAIVCHGRLAAERPHPSHLTTFYVCLAVGGALGAVFNGVAAPVAFDRLTEYPVALVLACLLIPGVRLPGRFGLRPAVPVVVAGVVAAALLVRPVLSDGDTIHRERSFFGTRFVELKGDTRRLLHGTTLHGAQSLNPELRLTPLTYYHPTGPLGQLVDTLRPRRAAMVGLGVGASACLQRRGDRWTFFEIDPAVLSLARDSGLFTYLRDCPGRRDFVLGDARLTLERRPAGEFDLIALDAFTSDAIPVHLLTREAVAAYVSRLAPEGVLAFHISNRYLDLEPVLGNVAAALRLACRSQIDVEVSDGTPGKRASHWMVITRRAEHLGEEADWPWLPCDTSRDRVWTDDYSNVLQVLRRRTLT
jgi:SAM-dependent methyltransferase